jgi:hypothetical protein
MSRQGMKTVRATVLALAGALALGVPAAAAPPPKNLWATVNICDTLAHPNQMGVRASMPGDGRRHERMFMRIQAQFYNPSNKRWLNVKGSYANSGWIRVGSARVRVRQAGYTFLIPANAGQSFVLRGVVDFQWRARHRTRTGNRRWVVVRELHANTKGQHPSAEADPPGYSSGTCEIRSP